MKKHYVYEIVNLNGIVEHVGESSNPIVRFSRHKSTKNGKFYKRRDIKINVVKEFENKEEAWWYQCELQIKNGLETDRQKNIRNAKRGAIIGGKEPQSILVYSANTGQFIAEFPSQNETGRSLGVSNISGILKSKSKSAKGYTFKLK